MIFLAADARAGSPARTAAALLLRPATFRPTRPQISSTTGSGCARQRPERRHLRRRTVRSRTRRSSDRAAGASCRRFGRSERTASAASVRHGVRRLPSSSGPLYDGSRGWPVRGLSGVLSSTTRAESIATCRSLNFEPAGRRGSRAADPTDRRKRRSSAIADAATSAADIGKPSPRNISKNAGSRCSNAAIVAASASSIWSAATGEPRRRRSASEQRAAHAARRVETSVRSKRRRIIQATRHLLMRHARVDGAPIRFDVVAFDGIDAEEPRSAVDPQRVRRRLKPGSRSVQSVAACAAWTFPGSATRREPAPGIEMDDRVRQHFRDSIAVKAGRDALAPSDRRSRRGHDAQPARGRQDLALRQRRLGGRCSALLERAPEPLRAGAAGPARTGADDRQLDADLDRQRLRVRRGLREAGAGARPARPICCSRSRRRATRRTCCARFAPRTSAALSVVALTGRDGGAIADALDAERHRDSRARRAHLPHSGSAPAGRSTVSAT